MGQKNGILNTRPVGLVCALAFHLSWVGLPDLALADSPAYGSVPQFEQDIRED